MTVPQAGDFAVTSVAGQAGRLIALGERLCGDGFSQYQHALVYIGDGQIVEAEPGGARCRRVSLPDTGYDRVEWSAGKIALSLLQRQQICRAARRYIGTPYSVLDYLAIAAHRLHVWTPGLAGYIASTGHMICSQLVDSAYLAAGVRLFDDGRWPGYVMPSDLAALISDPP